MVAGKATYADNCSACHMSNGEGVARLFPSLKNSGSVLAEDPTTILRVVLRGTQAVATDAAPTGPAMPPFGWRLDDTQIAALATYLRNTWGNAAGQVSKDQVKTQRAELASQP
nr:cytochrome c [Pseudomonas sp. LJDD11]